MLFFFLSLALAAQDADPAPSTPPAKQAEPKAREQTESKDKEPPVEEPPSEQWGGTAGLGFSWFTGDSSAYTVTGLVEAKRSWSQWAVGLRLEGAYGRSRPAAEVEESFAVVAERIGLQLRGDRNLTPRLAVYLLAGGDIDHVKSVQLRGTGEAGAGYVLAERVEEDYTRLRVETDVGVRFSREVRFQYYPASAAEQDIDDVNFLAPRVAGSLRWGFSKDVWLFEQVEVMPNVIGDARVLVRNTTRLSSALTEALALSATFRLQHDSNPAPGRTLTDTELALSLDAIF